MPPISGEWAKALSGEFKKPYYRELFQKVGEEYNTYPVERCDGLLEFLGQS